MLPVASRLIDNTNRKKASTEESVVVFKNQNFWDQFRDLDGPAQSVHEATKSVLIIFQPKSWDKPTAFFWHYLKLDE